MGIRILGVLVLVLLLLTPALVVWQARDLPRIEDADLLPPAPAEVPAAGDAFHHLERGAALLQWPESADVGVALAGDPEALGLLADSLEANAPALDALAEALAAPGFQVPPLESLDAEAHDVDGWKKLAELVCVRGLVRGEGGDSDLLAALELGQRLESARGADFVEGVVGVLVRMRALAALETWLSRHPLDAGAARALVARLDSYRSDPKAWYRIAGVEYAITKRFGLPGLEQLHAGDFGGDGATAAGLLPGRYYFQPNRTYQAFADRYRVVAENGGRRCAALEPVPGAGDAAAPSRLEILLTPNGGGKVLLAAGTPDLRRYHEQRCEMETRIGVLQVLAALHAWRGEHGELPESLDALVPTLLSAVPLDGFAGEPLRYDREESVLSSASGESQTFPIRLGS